MKGHLFVSLLVLIVLSFSLYGFREPKRSHPIASQGVSARFNQAYGKLPLAFEPNQGQTDASVKFLARGSGYTLFITSQEAVLSLRKPGTLSRPFSGKGLRSKGFPLPTPEPAPPTILRLKLDGVQANPVFESLEQLTGISNYFIGKNPAKWHTHIPQYSKVAVHGLYPGVDMVYYGSPFDGAQGGGQGKLEYDFVVQPGADPAAIHLKVDGAQSVQVNSQGDMELQTAQGKVVFRAPTVYQEAQGQKNPLEGHYKLEEGNRVGFEVKNYDRAKPLVIDPVLDYSTYLGGSGFDFASGITVDGSGDAYVTGCAYSVDFPTASGAYQTTTGGGLSDVFVAEMNPSGTSLVYSTYLGGDGTDSGLGIALGGSGNVYVTGETSSTNFPTTPGVFQTVNGGTFYKVFVTELNPSGTSLVYSTYLGGNSYDFGEAIAVDGSGNAYVTGYTTSANFPITSGVFQTVLGGAQNAFVTKLNFLGTALVYSTYLGGNNSDSGFGIAVDGSGNAYVTGETFSTNFPTTPGTVQAVYGGIGDAFVTKLNSSGTSLAYSTYLGGGREDLGQAIAVDGSGTAYVTGYTASAIFPTTSGAFQTVFGGIADAFVTRLNSSGTSLAYSTFLGGVFEDYGYGIAVDGSGNAYVTGETFSTNFRTTPGAYQMALGGTENAFVTELDPMGSTLAYSTYLGGSGNDAGQAIALDGLGNVYVAGLARSTNFPTTTGAFQMAYGGNSNAFIAKLSISAPTPTSSPTPTSTATFSATPTSTQTATSTFTETWTATATISITSSTTLTATQTPTPTVTVTPTTSVTSTPTFTFTPACPNSFGLSKNLFRPLKDSEPFQINIRLCDEGRYQLKVYNTAGEKIRILRDNQNQPPVEESVPWDGKNRSGEAVASGVYIIQFQDSNTSRIAKILVIR
jgi:hypothetical protein